MARIMDHLNMTSVVYHGCKATNQIIKSIFRRKSTCFEADPFGGLLTTIIHLFYHLLQVFPYRYNVSDLW